MAKIEVSMPDGSIKSFAGGDLTGRTPTSVQVSLAFVGMGRYEFVAIASDGSTSAPFAVEVRGAETSVEGPVINRVQPAQAMASREPQVFQVEGRRFDAGLRAIVTDPAGTDVTVAGGQDHADVVRTDRDARRPRATTRSWSATRTAACRAS